MADKNIEKFARNYYNWAMRNHGKITRDLPDYSTFKAAARVLMKEHGFTSYSQLNEWLETSETDWGQLAKKYEG
jgi:hypothetical protein